MYFLHPNKEPVKGKPPASAVLACRSADVLAFQSGLLQDTLLHLTERCCASVRLPPTKEFVRKETDIWYKDAGGKETQDPSGREGSRTQAG